MPTENSASVRRIGAATCCRAVVASARGAVRPRRPTRAELAAVPQTELPPARATVRFVALPQVSRPVPAPFVVEGARSSRRLQIGLRTYVIEHPQCRILLDPSISTSVRDRTLSAMPEPLRLAVTPPADVLSTVEALHVGGFDGADIDFALPTHLHWDHVSGLSDLPGLATVVHRPEWDWAMTGMIAPVAGVRPAMSGREIRNYELDGPPVLTFPHSHDLFGDGAVLLLDLAGHTPGSVGILLNTERGRLLVAGDAAWHHDQIDQAAQKPGFPGILVDEDRDATFETLVRLHIARSTVEILPTHDHVLATRWE
ncbi:MBL fold metallo-hydrolase [Tsukamurella sp. 8F]|uniref:MBL fold metallo-hydrolase n=1 Tax=unclassified Tsukamurella TaxID=2633480 RepID=UPI0023BA338B|nr:MULTISPECIES: MBL fold metallo-hydrolase [unclassified Tsukamurella]MDF0528401.1 MBL fold metallo-hydrolase [Tsukamurella sp. 8J]MDF0586226.1 MBL fold metallo-hydrolase [Tsukamurella sp. 8F]